MIEQKNEVITSYQAWHRCSTEPSVLDLIKATTDALPEQIAVTEEEYSFTYQQLHIASNNIANYLIQQGLVKGDRVALFLDKSVNTIATILGVLKAGGVYVPIDVNYPANRAKYMLSDTRARFLLTQEDLLARASN